MSLGHDEAPATLADCIRSSEELVRCLDSLAIGQSRGEAYPLKVAALRAVQVRSILESLDGHSGDMSPVRGGLEASAAVAPAAGEIEKALRALTANLMRLARGTGHADMTIGQIRSAAALFAQFESATDKPYPADGIARTLCLEQGVASDAADWPEWDQAMITVIQGALQIAASELLEQHTLAAAGRQQLFSGNRELERIHRRELGRTLRR